jgi:3-oxoacyl-[acyl-carrier protein] reductase
VKLVTDSGAKGKAIRFDVSKTEECNKAIDDTVKELGRLDVLVNNAGVAVDGLIMRFRDEDYAKTLDTNLKGAFNLIRAVSRPMMKQRSGAIINMTSIVGEMGNAGQAAYAASKAGLIGLTKAMAKELAPRNIRVNAVSPGFIETDMTTHIPEEAKKMMLQVTPLARLGKAEEVAAATVFLASSDAAYITGEVLKVNGGMYM